jgi:thiol-disulfide isomerase/thioredoxin
MKSTKRFNRFAGVRCAAVASLLALLFALAGCTGNGVPVPEETQAAGGDQAASTPLFGDFKAKDTEGNDVTNDVFADYEVTMVNIWASYCNPCVNEMPDLAELNGEYQDQGFQIVGIILDATDSKGSVDDAVLADAMDIIESTGADYTHIIPSAAMLGAYLRNISSVPTTVFVNSEGGIIGSAYVGSRSKADWAAIIDEKLGK